MEAPLSRWLRISFLNLLIVASLGVILRYKIAFAFPYLDQKHLLHGHSHFAFSGWITQILMVLLIQYLNQKNGRDNFKQYKTMLYANLITAYGMLIFFPIQGYGFGSITFSTLSIFVSYVFAIKYWKDLNRLNENCVSHYWFKAALIFSALSSLGAFSLAFMMVNKMLHQNWYLAAVYYFLHFQYNGWFFFAAMGLFVSRIEKIIVADKLLKAVFWLFAFACLPAFFLSALWMSIHFIVYWIVVASAIAQCIGWFVFVKLLLKNKVFLHNSFSKLGGQLFVLSAVALTIKLLLQLGSTHPALSQIAFGFRPIVIGYLHLVLLGVITIFILGFTISTQLLHSKKYFKSGVWIFVGGIILNETLLMVHGVASLTYTIVPFINVFLFMAALVMFLGILLLNSNIKNPIKQ